MALALGAVCVLMSAWAQKQAAPRARPGPPALPAPVRWEWAGVLTSGQSISIENPYGDVRARFGGYEGKVEIHAVLQNYHAGAAPLQVVPEATASGLDVRVRRKAGEPTTAEAGAVPQDRVDLVVRVPQGAPLKVVTRSGAIGINGLKSLVSAESEGGAISVREVEGSVQTFSRYGATSIILEPPPPGSRQTFESVTGDISVTLPAHASASVLAQTSGWITTDISLQISRNPHEEPSKTARGKVGSGAASLVLRTKRGDLQILQMEDFRDPAKAPSNGAVPDPEVGGQ